MIKVRSTIIALVISVAGMSTSLATIPVIDIAAVPQWVMQAANMLRQIAEQVRQYEQLVSQLNQLKTTYQSTTGNRNFESLLMGAANNASYQYLPADTSVMAGIDTYGKIKALSASIEKARGEVTSLTTANFTGKMDSASAQMWQRRVDQLARMREVSNAAAQAATDRVASNDSLIKSIGTTDDPKSIAELQARMAGEQARIANDQIRVYAAAMQNHSVEEINQAMQGDMLMTMDKKPIPKVVYKK